MYISVCNCSKDRLNDRHSCLNLYPCVIKFNQSINLSPPPLSLSVFCFVFVFVFVSVFFMHILFFFFFLFFFSELSISQTCLAGVIHSGVFNRGDVIAKGVKYGPFKGKIVNTSEIKTFDDNSYMWEVSIF